MDLLGGLTGGSIFSGIANWFGGELQNRRAADAAEQAQSFSASQFASRYQTTVNDLKAAGLNPMLAYSQGGGSPPSGAMASVPANPGANASSAFMAAKVQDAQADLLQAQAENVNADTAVKRVTPALIESQISATGASADQSRATINNLEYQSKRIAEEIKNIPKEGDRLVALAKQLDEHAALLRKQGATQDMITNQTKWLAVKTMFESDLSKLDVKAAESMDNIGREANQLRPIFDILRGLLRR